MKYLIGILFFTTSLNLFGQVAIINDKDGFTNVRLKPQQNSEIIYNLKTNQVFWFGEEDFYSDNVDWIMVEITKNKYSIECGSLDNLIGYVHKSRIKPLNTIKEYKGTELEFYYKTQPFNEKNKIIDYQNDYIVSIEGLHPWGTDGGKPKIEVKELEIKIKENSITVPEILISDIYECDNNFNIYKIGQTYFVHQWNSDGAGAYEIVWVFTEKGIEQRLVGTII
ncbi:hypothetical protein GGR42_002526 [Saonia flava]|uniref:SH3 domain-containing protein n=1 Tax=Saonia flava TaxID=523696 RepID=A0A846R277_9FLAO|nr:hypothetical protein [Saonia flava]NJB72035.1 hypothetical protein [Saonia flava]